MTTRLNPYLSFRDNARQAMEFYHSVFGGDLTLSTFGEMNASEDPAEQDKIMHSVLTSSGGLVLMGSDTPQSRTFTPGANGAVALGGEDQAELRGYWDRLSDGGTILAPFERAPWGDLFGMCTDRFGVNWLVNVASAPA